MVVALARSAVGCRGGVPHLRPGPGLLRCPPHRSSRIRSSPLEYYRALLHYTMFIPLGPFEIHNITSRQFRLPHTTTFSLLV